MIFCTCFASVMPFLLRKLTIVVRFAFFTLAGNSVYQGCRVSKKLGWHNANRGCPCEAEQDVSFL